MNGWRLQTSVAGVGLALLLGCAGWHRGPALPSGSSLVLDQLVVFSDTPLPAHHRLLEELRFERSLVSTKLALPVSDEPIHVYLFPTAEKLDDFMRLHHPTMPRRRAFFIETDTRLSVYAYWGDRVAEDLRHEVAHGYLHAVVPHLPLWLDEGLAEYFEVPRGQAGVNRPHVMQLTAQLGSAWHPNLERLENLSTTGEMSQGDYAESWAWVHWMLESSPERLTLLREYLSSIAHGSPERLSERLARFEPEANRRMADHVMALSTSLR